jgi:very-short-patch-repair endonuclease
MTERARRLRKEPTDAERKIWRALRRNQIDGLSFRRQHPIGPYTLDFYCPEVRLGIEIDGGQHALPDEAQKDLRRSQWLSSKKISILRFWNNDALRNTEGVLAEIARVANQLTPSPTLPLSGGGRSKRRES